MKALAHVCFIVKDLDASTDFYCDKLGLTQEELARARTLAQTIRKEQKATDEQAASIFGQCRPRPHGRLERSRLGPDRRAGLDAVLPSIETFPNQFPGYEIEIVIPEFTSVCPKTGLPDFGVLTLRYMPDQRCVELKSFKEYLLAFRDLGIFHENVVNRVLDDVIKTCKPRSATLTGVFNSRGGIQTTVKRDYAAGHP